MMNGSLTVRPLAVRQTTENSRLLYDDIQHDQYGSLNGGAVQGAPPVDAQDAQREEAALRRILAQTSDHLIDVFALHPPSSSAAQWAESGFASDARWNRYQTLLRQAVPSRPTILATPTYSERDASERVSDSGSPQNGRG
ncbi:MAG: hypothetical protein M1823_002102 [Watsoniomyces obsoletus]|nr:MAG: hypothetical protein M1823_002102 [Watsoniomyces obsoletus]